MDIHKNARLSFRSRESLARFVFEQGATRKAAAAAFRVSAKTVAKWIGRYRQFGAAGVADRSSRPRFCPRQTSSSLVEEVVVLRRSHMPGYEVARSHEEYCCDAAHNLGEVAGFVFVERSTQQRAPNNFQGCACGAALGKPQVLRCAQDDICCWESKEPGPKGLLVCGVFRGAEAPRFHWVKRGRTAVRPFPHPRRGMWGTRVWVGAKIAGTADPSPSRCSGSG